MPQFTQLRYCLNRALRSKFNRPQNNDVDHGVDQQKLQNGLKKRDCRLDKNAILYDAFLQDSPFFEPRFRDRRTGNCRMRYVSDWSINPRAYERLGNKFAGARTQKRFRARILFDRILLPTDLWSLAAIWAGGVQFAGLVYIEKERRERHRLADEPARNEESPWPTSTSTPCASASATSELHPLLSRLCVWPICSTVSCMRDGNSTVNWIRSAHSSTNWVVHERSAQPTSWIEDTYSTRTEVPNEPYALRRIATSPELRTAPFNFRFDKAARSYLTEIEAKFRLTRDAFSRQTSNSQQSLVDVRTRSLDDLSSVSSGEQSDNTFQPKAYDVLPQSGQIPTPPTSPSVQSAKEQFEIKSFNRIVRPDIRLDAAVEKIDSDSECDSDETQSSCDESDALSTVSSESEGEMRSLLFHTAADFKPLDALDIQLGPIFASLNRDVARREHARALDAAHSFLQALSQPMPSTSTSESLKRVLIASSDREAPTRTTKNSLDDVSRAFTCAVQHAERAGDEQMRSRILFNQAVFHELTYRNGQSSGSLSGVPDALRAAKRCYVEALEADRYNVRAAANLAALCWMISTQLPSSKLTQRAYDRRARKYAKMAADLGDENAVNFLAAISHTHALDNESASESESEQYVPATRIRPFEFDSNRFAFG